MPYNNEPTAAQLLECELTERDHATTDAMIESVDIAELVSAYKQTIQGFYDKEDLISTINEYASDHNVSFDEALATLENELMRRGIIEPAA